MTSAWPESAEPALSALIRVAARLRAAGCVFAEDEAELLLEASSGPADLDRLVTRRAEGEPLEHLLGWAEFAGLRVAVGPGVFVPRRRSELLVRLAADHLLLAEQARSPAVVVDLCCGSGVLGAAVAATLERRGGAHAAVEVFAADVDPAATDFARRNLAPWAGKAFTGDLFAAFPGELNGRTDVILANAPYVPTAEIAFMPAEARDHEPLSALDGGPDGLDLHRRIAAEAPHWLAPGGLLLIEVSERQAGAAAEMLAAVGLHVRTEEDGHMGAVAVVGAAARAGEAR